MIVEIKEDRKKIGQIFCLRESFNKILLKADVGYNMRIYNSENENYDFVTACEKIEKTIKKYVYIEDIDSITILRFKYRKEKGIISEPELIEKGAKSLIAEIYFKPDNRVPNSKITRWPIRMYDDDGFFVKRIPIIIKPFWQRTAFFVLYCSGAVILSDVYAEFSRCLLENTAFSLLGKYLFVKFVVVFVAVWIAIWSYDRVRIFFERKSFRL